MVSRDNSATSQSKRFDYSQSRGVFDHESTPHNAYRDRQAMHNCRMSTQTRCPWCGEDPLYVAYHDEEWGVPCHDDRKLFEFLILEGAQAGLSWITILRKRENYRRAFSDFDAEAVALFGEADIARLLADTGIVRNRLKIVAAIDNARAFLKVREEFGSFDAYCWAFVGNKPILNTWRSLSEVPAETDISRAMSHDLRKRGFRFVGPTIMYAHMQATGMVNDHLISCCKRSQA